MPNPLLDTKVWFELAVPNPTTKNINAQTGVHFEEVVEMLDELGGLSPESQQLIANAKTHLKRLATFLKEAGDTQQLAIRSQVGLLDSLCDQVVTAVGVAHMHGYHFLPAMGEVNASNFSKFVDGVPVFKAGGKIDKGPHFFRPDLTKFLPL